jgi:hypothetical protein
MSDEEREKPKRPVGNVTMQIDAYRDQIELYDDAEDGDDADGATDEGADDADEGDVEAGRSVAPPPLPPRTTHAPTPTGSPAPNASGGSKVGVIAIGVVVAAAAVGAALWLSGVLVEEPPQPTEPAEPPALEIGPIEIDTTAQ